MIKDRNLKPGTMLVARYKGETYRCEVVSSPEGIRYRVVISNKQFKSLSAAGSAVMGGIACNGWRFWSLEGSEEAKPKAKAKAEAAAETFRTIPGGRAYCESCAAAFKVEAGTTPATCPEGHTP